MIINYINLCSFGNRLDQYDRSYYDNYNNYHSKYPILNLKDVTEFPYTSKPSSNETFCENAFHICSCREDDIPCISAFKEHKRGKYRIVIHDERKSNALTYHFGCEKIQDSLTLDTLAYYSKYREKPYASNVYEKINGRTEMKECDAFVVCPFYTYKNAYPCEAKHNPPIQHTLKYYEGPEIITKSGNNTKSGNDTVIGAETFNIMCNYKKEIKNNNFTESVPKIYHKNNITLTNIKYTTSTVYKPVYSYIENVPKTYKIEVTPTQTFNVTSTNTATETINKTLTKDVTTTETHNIPYTHNATYNVNKTKYLNSTHYIKPVVVTPVVTETKYLNSTICTIQNKTLAKDVTTTETHNVPYTHNATYNVNKTKYLNSTHYIKPVVVTPVVTETKYLNSTICTIQNVTKQNIASNNTLYNTPNAKYSSLATEKITNSTPYLYKNSAIPTPSSIAQPNNISNFQLRNVTSNITEASTEKTTGLSLLENTGIVAGSVLGVLSLSGGIVLLIKSRSTGIPEIQTEIPEIQTI